MPSKLINSLSVLLSLALTFFSATANGCKNLGFRKRTVDLNDSLVYLWPLPKEFSHGEQILTVDPDLTLHPQGAGGNSDFVVEAFERYKDLVFKQRTGNLRRESSQYDIEKLTVVVASDNETLQLGVDESYTLYIAAGGGGRLSVVGGATIEANTIYGALRGLETFSQLCIFNYETKTVEVSKAPWYIQDEPRFAFRGLLLDLWKGAYSKWERYTVEDAYEVVNFAKRRGIHILAEIDVPGHAESWGTGYPDLWPSPNCTEPLDVTKDFTFEVISGILTDMRKIFPFGLFHLGGDEVNTDCWNSSSHVKQWLQQHNMTTKDAYQYFVLRAQEIAISHNWIPVNWEETFNTFKEKLNPHTVVHNWLGPGVCPQAVAKGFRCIVSNQGVWYLDHLDIPWEDFYNSEPLEGINDSSQQELVLGGEVCMWAETADTSVVQQTIWPRAAAAAERLWSPREATSTGNTNTTVLPRLHYFRCLLNHRGVPAAPVTNRYARNPPIGPGSCFVQ